MGWLDKFVVKVENESVGTEAAVAAIAENLVPVQAEIASTANIVSEIFAQNNMAERDNSIYIVQELIATLPPEMTTAKKQGTVAGILKVSGKSAAALVEDANVRSGILRAACDQILADRTAENDIAKADIEDLKRAIEAATIKIAENDALMEATKKAIDDEVAAINELVEFCNGMEAK